MSAAASVGAPDAILGHSCQACGHRWLLHAPASSRDPICIAWTDQQFCKCAIRAPASDMSRLDSENTGATRVNPPGVLL